MRLRFAVESRCVGLCGAVVSLRETLGMVVNGWLVWARRRWANGCPPGIGGSSAPSLPSGATLLLSEYRCALAILTGIPARAKSQQHAEAVTLSLSQDPAKLPRAARPAGQTVLRYVRAAAHGNTRRPPMVGRGIPCGKGACFGALPEPQGSPGTAERAKGSSHQLAVRRSR